MSFKVFIQARMSSNRLPGKVLMPFNGRPIIQNVVDAVGVDKAVVITSIEPSDDPLADYLVNNHIHHFRGDLNDVLARFCSALHKFKPEWVMRICADSPLIPSYLIKNMSEIERGNHDLITNVFPRTFPKGHSVEILKSEALLALQDMEDLTADDREHVTSYFYRNNSAYKILSVTQPENMNDRDYAVDTREDYERLSKLGNLDLFYNAKKWKVTSNV